MNKSKIRILSLLVAVVCIICVLPLSVSAKSPSGIGSVDDPYLITCIDDLIDLRDRVHSGNDMSGVYFLQTVDIDLASDERTKIWEPIGTTENGGRFFFGIYNGGGHVIKNLNTEASVSGLFSFLGGTVMNLGIESGHIKGDYVGAIASHATGGTAKIINCYSLAAVSGIRAGGLADNFHGGTIVDSFAYPTLEGSEAVGGLVAYGATNIIDSFSVGEYAPIGADRVIFSEGELGPIPADTADVESLKARFRERSDSYTTPIKQIAGIDEGNGTQRSPFVITNAEQLRRVSLLVSIGNGTNFFDNWFIQKKDIDLSAFEAWQPIGTESSVFGGVYDGGGHSISNLNVRGESGKYVGFFGYIQGTVMNLGIESGSIEGDYAAAIVGRSTSGASVIVNCYNNASVTGKISAAGIANSFPEGLIASCLNTGSIESEGKSAGICADSIGKMQSCYSVGLPVSCDGTDGMIKKSCRQIDSASEAAELLNASLYDTATVSGYQRNDLVKWSSDGRLSEETHNYLSRFILHEILIAFIVFAIAFLCYILYRTSKRTSSLKLTSCQDTLVLEKARLFSTRDARIQSIVTLGFIGAFLMVLVGLINQDSAIMKAFSWPDQGDAFMDFFNPLHTVLNGNYSEAGHYTDPKSTYPPVIKGILWLFSQLLPKNIQLLSAKAIRSSTVGILIIVVTFMLCYFILHALFGSFINKKSKLIPIFALFCSPMIFLLDRGNTLIFVLVLSALFIAGYRSKNPLIRHLSYVCLGLAAAIKIYPVVLGILVVREKKWKETFWCLAWGAALCIVPFLIIGIDELLLYIRNVSSSFERNAVGERTWLIDYRHVLSNLADKLNIGVCGTNKLASITLYPVTLLLAACAFLANNRWKSILAVMLIQILFPGFTVYYCASLLIIPLLLMIGEGSTKKIDYLYASLMTLALIPLQFLCGAIGVLQGDIWLISGVATLTVAILLIVDCAICTAKNLTRKKS